MLQREVESKIKEHSSQLEQNIQQIKDINISPRTFGAKFDGINDDSLPINKTIEYLKNNGGGRLILPSATIKCNSKIIVPYGFSIEGAEKGFNDRGTIIYRDDIVNGDPIFEIGEGGSAPFSSIKNLTIVGSTIDENSHGIVNNSVGIHGLLIENVNFIHMAGTPIIINSVNGDSRAEFIDIINCRSGVDWEGLKAGKTTKCTNSNCTGVLIKGNADSVRISKCNFIASNNRVGIGIKIIGDGNLLPGDLFVIEQCGIYGNDIGIYSIAREIEIKNNYIENNKTSVRLETRTSGVGENIATINNNMFASTNYCIDLIDNGTDARKSIHGAIFSNFVINKWDGTDIRFIKTLSTSKFSSIHCFGNGFTEVKEENGTIKFWASGSSKVGFYGQIELDDFKHVYNLNNPKIYNDVTNDYYYQLSLNAVDGADNGFICNDKDGNRMFQFKRNSAVFYKYSTDGNNTRGTGFEMDFLGRILARNGIVVYSSSGKGYKITVNDSGEITTVTI